MAVPGTIREGSVGEEVELVQYELCRLLYLDGPGDVDGSFGPVTLEAVRSYQSDHGLGVDGIVGPVTWAMMLTEHPRPPILAEGSSGRVVTKLQQFLNLADPPASPQLPVDGHFGPRTSVAVVDYQRAAMVPDDGIVGYKTWVIHVGAADAMVATEVGV
jgi:peptidoglycan hydrolase-like protein with peptidoglycan-binding domain